MTNVINKVADDYDAKLMIKKWCESHPIVSYYLFSIGTPIVALLGVCIATFAIVAPIALLMGFI